jgi:hypothetical protein
MEEYCFGAKQGVDGLWVMAGGSGFMLWSLSLKRKQ